MSHQSMFGASNESMFDDMKRYVRFSDDDARLLSSFRAVAAPSFPRIAAEFYDRIREHEEAHAVFTDEAQIGRLQGALVRWLDRLCSGPYDEAYFEQTAKIGRMHVRVGLPQRYMFTAMALIRVALSRIADATMKDDAPRAREAIGRALDLELAIMLETYRNDFVARLKNVDRLEKQEAARTLRRTEHRYVGAVELARVLIVGLDARGVVLLFNREAERVTGFARDEVLGKPFAEVLSGTIEEGSPDGERRGEVERVLASAMSAAVKDANSGAADATEMVIHTRSGKLRDVRWQVAHAPSDLQDEVVFFAIGRDVTDENALSARVRQSEKLAAVGTLAAGLAHEIRNPLNGAQLHVTFVERALERDGINGGTRAAVGVIRDEIRRLSALVTEFLEFARPQPLQRRPASVHALFSRILSLLAPQAEAGGVRLDCQEPSTDPIVDLDPSRMEQVLLNLGQNAIEALGPAGGGTVVFRVRRLPRYVSIEVEDDGPGLPAPGAPIFDPFYSTKPSGTGLGLAIAHRIVTDHGGSLDVRSEPGKTVFQIMLPISSAPFTMVPHATGRRE